MVWHCSAGVGAGLTAICGPLALAAASNSAQPSSPAWNFTYFERAYFSIWPGKRVARPAPQLARRTRCRSGSPAWVWSRYARASGYTTLKSADSVDAFRRSYRCPLILFLRSLSGPPSDHPCPVSGLAFMPMTRRAEDPGHLILQLLRIRSGSVGLDHSACNPVPCSPYFFPSVRSCAAFGSWPCAMMRSK